MTRKRNSCGGGPIMPASAMSGGGLVPKTKSFGGRGSPASGGGGGGMRGWGSGGGLVTQQGRQEGGKRNKGKKNKGKNRGGGGGGWGGGQQGRKGKAHAARCPELAPMIVQNRVAEATAAVNDWWGTGSTKWGNQEPEPLSHGMAFNALVAIPQAANPEDGANFVSAIARGSVWPEKNAYTYFVEKCRQAVLEFLGEAESTIDRIRTGDYNYLVQSGRCVYGATFSSGRKPGTLMCEGGEVRTDQDRRGLEAGDTVALSPLQDQRGGGRSFEVSQMVEADVVVARPLIVKPINSNESSRLLNLRNTKWRIDKLANRIAFTRTVAAVHLATAPPGSTSKKGKGLPREHRPSDKVLNVLLARKPGEAQVDAMVGYGNESASRCALDGMNRSQVEALKATARNCVTLVQGPPGTGKTTCAVRILRSWASTDRDKILATSDSNIAVDNLVEGLAAEGVRVVRMGRPETARPELLKHCVDDIARTRLGYATARDVPKEGREREAYSSEVTRVARDAQVVCCTAVGAGSGLLSMHAFSKVLIDEASQATELATIVPFCRGAKQVVLCGDHCQLPPTVASQRAKDEGAELSLFERLVRDAGVKPHMLTMQYRMHPAISDFPRRNFYAGKLEDGIDGSRRLAPGGFPWPDQNNPVAFVPVMENPERKDGDSFCNEAEAQRVVQAVKDLLAGGLQKNEVGVVTPYAAQVRLIRRLLQNSGIVTFRDQSGVEVASVDGYQGREKETIVMSTVRSSERQGIGFVADWRRANVAMTRAKRGLIIFGDPRTLGREASTWAPWLRSVYEKRLYLGRMPEPPPPPHGGPPPVGLAAEASGKWTGTEAKNQVATDNLPHWDAKKIAEVDNSSSSSSSEDGSDDDGEDARAEAMDAELGGVQSRGESRGGGKGNTTGSRNALTGMSGSGTFDLRTKGGRTNGTNSVTEAGAGVRRERSRSRDRHQSDHGRGDHGRSDRHQSDHHRAAPSDHRADNSDNRTDRQAPMAAQMRSWPQACAVNGDTQAAAQNAWMAAYNSGGGGVDPQTAMMQQMQQMQMQQHMQMQAMQGYGQPQGWY